VSDKRTYQDEIGRDNKALKANHTDTIIKNIITLLTFMVK